MVGQSLAERDVRAANKNCSLTLVTSAVFVGFLGVSEVSSSGLLSFGPGFWGSLPAWCLRFPASLADRFGLTPLTSRLEVLWKQLGSHKCC